MTLPLWQTEAWKRFQNALGLKTMRIAEQLMVVHPLFLRKRYAYFPRGPILKSDHEKQIWKQELDRIAKKEQLIFCRIDPEEPMLLPKAWNFRSSFSVQPESTLILNLNVTESELLAQMKRKGRYNILFAKKKGVLVKKAISAAERSKYCDLFYKLLISTGQRDEFFIHNRNYYQTMLERIPESEIFVAFYKNHALAAGIFVYLSDRAYYYYGASSNDHRELMAPYLLQWEAILAAKRRGCKTYDFLGIAPPGSGPKHPWRGITEFKLKFGGQIVQYPKPMDIVYNPVLYQIYRMLKWIQRMRRHESIKAIRIYE